MEDTSSKKPRRLGRGLSGLLGDPVPVATVSIHKHVEPSSAPNVAPPEETPGKDRGIVSVAVGAMVPNPFQPRRVFDQVALERLADSIKRSGLMQPVIVRPRGEGKYEIVAGERRWRAATIAGLDAVPAIVRELGDEETAEWAIVENVQREDLNPMERAYAFRALVDRFGLTHAQISERVGQDRSTVVNTIRLTELEEAIREMISNGRLTAGHGKALLMSPPGAARIKLAEQASDESWSVRRLERAATELATQATQPAATASPSARSGPDLARAAARADLERQLSEHLGTKVSVVTDRSGAKGKLSIEFYGLEHFDGLLARLGFQMR